MTVRAVRLLVTGAAGFIGAALCERLVARGDEVVGVDNLSAYYDIALKEARLARLIGRTGFAFERLDLADRERTAHLFRADRFDAVAHLAAQAGVRYSVEHPEQYVDANLVGFANVLEGCRRARVSLSPSCSWLSPLRKTMKDDRNVRYPSC